MVERIGSDGRSRRTAHDDIPWTVARCNRLLRSIFSRIATIRRIVDNFEQAPIKTFDSPAIIPMQKSGQATANNAVLPYLQSPNNQDPEWMPQARKASSRTYGGKDQARRSVAKSIDGPNSGSPALRTPFLRTLLRPTTDNSPLPQPPLAGAGKKDFGRMEGRRSRQLPIRSTTTLAEAQQQLASAFRPFLQATMSADPPSRMGARSLHQMCLKQVPQHIELEQAWLDERDEGADADATNDVYAHLEGLGQGAGAGFAGLRHVVRAHGLRTITNAIIDGLVPDAIVRQLIETCKQCNAIAEGQSVLQTWAEAVVFSRKSHHSRKIEPLVDASNELDSPSFMLRQLARLFEAGKLGSLHLDDAGAVWRVSLQKLASPTASLDAMQFLEAYAMDAAANHQSLQQRDTKCHSSSYSVAVLLTAMIWQQHTAIEAPMCNSGLMWQLQRLLHGALLGPHYTPAILRPFVLAALVGGAATSHSIPESMATDAEFLVDALCLESTTRPGTEDVDFVIEVARILSHVDGDMAAEMMRALMLWLAKTSTQSSDRRSIAYLKRLAVDSAMAWAESQDDAEGYDWAENIEALFSSSNSGVAALHTPASCRPAKYRWEACISEWIRATPYDSKRQPIVAMEGEIATPEDSGICMPASESPSRKRSRSPSTWDDDSDLEDRDELSMQTPELIRLRDQRARKKQRQSFTDAEKENVRPNRARKQAVQQQHFMMEDESSEDELGL